MEVRLCLQLSYCDVNERKVCCSDCIDVDSKMHWFLRKPNASVPPNTTMTEKAAKRRPVRPHTIRARKHNGPPITLVSAYDYPFARFADLAEIDIVFVSDALASVGLGRDDTLSVTMDEMVYHTQAVKRGAGNSLVLAALPFLSYSHPKEAIANAGRLLKDGGAAAVEVEGCAELADTVAALTSSGVGVVAHVGLTKKIASRTGSYRTQGQDSESALTIIEDALTLAEAGAFAIILECVPDRVAAIVTDLVSVPTIGIGAGPYCDGQGLISQDMLGLYDKFAPKFVHQFGQLGGAAVDAFRAFQKEVGERRFPAERHTVSVGDDILIEMLNHVQISGVS